MFVEYWRFARANPRFLGFGFLLAFLSSAGQTYFIGAFGADIQADFGLDPGSWGRIYMAGTLASALVINWTGSLLDRFDLRLFTVVTLLGLTLACLVMGTVTTVPLLVVAVFLLRQFGQGLASHVGITSMARYHDAGRGKAIALATIGFACGEASLPVLGVLASELFGWRQAFYLAAAVVFVAIAGALWLLRGHTVRHTAHRSALDEGLRSGARDGDYSRAQALAEPRFYLMMPAQIAMSMIGTAFFFFPTEIAAAKGWSKLWLTGNYWLYSIAAVTMIFFSGVLIDRFGARRVVPFVLLPFALALIVINLGEHRLLVWPYLMFMGLASGLHFTSTAALWAELYGARHLGSIKSLINAVMVFSSALGPAIMGSMLEWGFSFFTISMSFLGFVLFALASFLVALSQPGKQSLQGSGPAT